MNRDLRRGEPNADPLLREIERITAQRYRRAGAVTAVVGPIAVVALAVFAVIADSVAFTLVGAVGSVAMLGAAVYQLQLNRGMKAFT